MKAGLSGRLSDSCAEAKIDDNSYDVILTDKETGKVSHTFKYTVTPDGKTLTFTWMNTGEEQPFSKLVYDKQ